MDNFPISTSFQHCRHRRVPLTEFDRTVLNDEVRGIRLVVDLPGFTQKLQKTLSVDKGLVDRAVEIAEHVQRTVQLSKVRDEEHKLMGLRLAPHNTESNNQGPNKKAKRLDFGIVRIKSLSHISRDGRTMMKFWTRLRRLRETRIRRGLD